MGGQIIGGGWVVIMAMALAVTSLHGCVAGRSPHFALQTALQPRAQPLRSDADGETLLQP